MRIKYFFKAFFNWELWNFYILYAPLFPAWLWYCIKSGSLWFFTPSNPGIAFGGFEGEGKKEMYDLLPSNIIPHTIYIQPRIPFNDLLTQIKLAGFSYPFIVKPDVGMKGILFRIIENEKQLLKYHDRIPVEYIVQEKIDYPIEVSVFYYRLPWLEKGVVSGFIQKDLLQVKGDGVQTLKQLISNNPRAKLRMEEMESRHAHRFDRIIPANEIFYLSFAGNHNRGASFKNLYKEINNDLVDLFDQLSKTASFFYGRYDIKTKSIEDLKAGKNFAILEYNGAGAEPNHIYDCNKTIWQAYAIILQHWSALYKIGKYNAKNGHPYWPYKKGMAYLKAARKHFDMLEKFD